MLLFGCVSSARYEALDARATELDRRCRRQAVIIADQEERLQALLRQSTPPATKQQPLEPR